MAITRTRFSVPVETGEPIRCILMKYPGNRKELYAAAPDIEKFLYSQCCPANIPAEGVLQDWEYIEDAIKPGLIYYALSVIPWLIEMKANNALVRDRIIRLIRIASKRADA